MDYAIILPTAWGYINKFLQYHYGGLVMGILLSVFALSGAIAGIILGYLNDRGTSLKRLVLFGILFKIVGNLLYFIGINIYIIVLSRLIAGIGMGLVVRRVSLINDTLHFIDESSHLFSLNSHDDQHLKLELNYSQKS